MAAAKKKAKRKKRTDDDAKTEPEARDDALATDEVADDAEAESVAAALDGAALEEGVTVETEMLDDEEVEHDGESSMPVPLPRQLPTRLIVLPVDDVVMFPGMMMPAFANSDRARATITQAMSQSKFLGILTRRPEPPKNAKAEIDTLYTVGCVARIAQRVGGAGADIGVLLTGLRRFRVVKWIRSDPVMIAQVEYPDDVLVDAKEAEALERVVRREVAELVSLRPDIPEELGEAVANQRGVARFVDFLSGHIGLPIDERQDLLETFEIDLRLRTLMGYFERELDLARIGKKVRSDIQEKVEKQQRDFYLREQLKALRQELGEEVDEKEIETETYDEKIREAEMPAEVEERARYELRRLSVLPQEAAEYHVIRTYLDWLVDLPWSKSSEDRLDIARSAKILDEDHYGLEEVKQRIVEFLAVRKLAPERQGAILCLVGPPGVGKTSLGKSIARAMNREFHRVSLGGMRDEAEIKGHRRTYIGAMPGKIIQGIKRVGTNNPVFMLDEIDKLGSDWRGDPSSAMLEVLDPAQNDKFEDYYLDVPFDLSRVMFVATANYAGQIPAPLYDRMEVIDIPGYILSEKRSIATKYLVPRQLEAHGLTKSDLKLPYATLRAIVEGYTREAGVRGLERRIAQVCRKIAAQKAMAERKRRKPITVTPDDLDEYLGRRKFDRENELRTRRPGVVTGLAWTPFGGDVLFIETRTTPGKGQVRVTGQLGSVMSESVQIASTIVRSEADRFDIDPAAFQKLDIHIHVPAGAVPKDGPSAGVTMTTALVSLLCRKGKGLRVSSKIAMTGEITLSGTVLPVGGIREKVVAAKRQGIKTVILPRTNEPDLDDVPERVKKGLTFVFAETFDDVLAVALPKLVHEE